MDDIVSREDIELLVDRFYQQVIKDDLIGHFFTEVVQLDWEKHIPVMYDFWETTLLGNIKYRGNPMLKHVLLNEKKSLGSKHFERWLLLWESTINQYFQGAKATEAIKRAQQIAALMKFKIAQNSNGRS